MDTPSPTPLPDAIERYGRGLGHHVRARWSAAGWNDTALADIAMDALATRPPHEVFDADALFDAVLGGLVMPAGQLDPAGRFGQPPISLYVDDMLEIQALCWFEATTSIHEHGFTGAFVHVAGGSVHARYTFAEDKRLSDRVRLGRLGIERLHVLGPGDPQPIGPGPGTIHAVFHLDDPSISLVVRSRSLFEARHQMMYAPPALAYSPRDRAPLGLSRRLALIGSLARRKDERLLTGWATQLAHWHLHEVVLGLQVAFSAQVDARWLQPVLDACQARWGADFERVLTSLREDQARMRFALARGVVRDRLPRLVVAALAFAPARSAVCELLAAAYPHDDPTEQLIAGLDALMEEPAAHDVLAGSSGLTFSEGERWVLRGFAAGHGESGLLERVAGGQAPEGVDATLVMRLGFALPLTTRLGVLLR
jgi:hypothetical protein